MVHRLYEKVGGRTTINALVHVFYERVQADEKLSRFFSNTDMENLRARQAMFLSMLLGGEQQFTGRDLKAAHADSRRQGMDDDSFDALMRIFRESLEEVQVEPAYIEEILTLLESKRDAVLGR